MISIEEYKKDPCKALSIPYWKAKKLTIPANMKMIHGDDFDEKLLNDYFDSKYFRLLHRLEHIPDHTATGIDFELIGPDMANELADMINSSYAHSGIRVSADFVKGLASTHVYCPRLWIGAFSDGRLVGSIICDFDAQAREAAIEWLQVLPGFRRAGIASALVCKALKAAGRFADFATVSGECDNITNPEGVYRRCGFEGEDVWHILTEK